MTANFEGQDLLYKLAYECEGLFDQLQESFQKTKSEVATIELCAEFQQRFAIWAAHLGVFARKSQCLDTRLRNLPDLQDLVARLLDILRRSLQQCTIDTSSQGDAVAIGFNEFPPRAPQIQTAVLRTIDDTLTRLNRLGVTIRQSGRGKFDSRAKKFAAGLDLGPFTQLCENAVQALYPGAHRSLKDHLSKSMTDRYARMLFLDSRHKKLETRRELRAGLPPIHEVPNNETQTSIPIIQLAMAINNPVVTNRSRAHTALSQSDLSSVNAYQIRSRLRPADEASTKFHKTSSIQVNQGNYPQLPVTKQGSSIFTCQWCSELLSKKTLSESEWRQHIDRDLKPYICLSEGCQEAHPVYPTFVEWFRHMEFHDWRWHQQVYLTSSWVCTVCEFNQDVYSSPQTLYSHLEESHSSDFTNAQLQAISRQSKTEQPRAWNDCLLCCFAVEGQGNNDEALFPKRRKGQSKQETTKSARKTLEMASPNPHSEFSDTSSDSDDMGSHQHRRQHNKDRSKAVTWHIAVHLQVLMLLTLRFAAALQDDGDLDDGTKSDSVDIDEGNSASEGTDLGRISHIASEVDVTMRDGQEVNDAENTEDAMDLDEDVDGDILKDDIPVPDTDVDLEFVPRQYDDLAAKNDDFLSKVIESGAYQSWRDEPNAFEYVVMPPPDSDPILEEADRHYRVSVTRARKMASGEDSLDESVVDKWQRPPADEVVTIVTPPDTEAKEEYKSPYDPPNADVKIDNDIYPNDIHRFKVAHGAADVPTFKSRIPVLRARSSYAKSRPSHSRRQSVPELGSGEKRQLMKASQVAEEELESFPQFQDDVAVRLNKASAKLVSWGENSTYEAEEDFSPHLKRVGHVDFDRIAEFTASSAQPLDDVAIRLKEADEAENPRLIHKQAKPKAEAESEAAAKKAALAPIEFKDAVGRKFSFPFHLCNTWQGMEHLIKQAFLQVDLLGPHVQEGHYDLIGPTGDLILPSVWENVVKPGWAITMTMWPLDKAPLVGRPEPPLGKPPMPPPPSIKIVNAPPPKKKRDSSGGSSSMQKTIGYHSGKPLKK